MTNANGIRTTATWFAAAATASMFALSYRGLFNYAGSIGVPAWLAWLYPFMLDLTIVTAELVLLSTTDRRVRAWAWAVVAVFAAVSGVANAGLLPPQAGKGLPPVLLAVVLGFAVGEHKRRLAAGPTEKSEPVPPRVRQPVRRQPSTTLPTGGGKRGPKLDEAAEAEAVRIYTEIRGRGDHISERALAELTGGGRTRARRAMDTVDANGHLT